ncbi:MAG: hypothetical protein HZB81_07955 [Deltaproteobacteria bacterium]|nr:hypothetical protein [Deltaproteobacteria bacterium]
MKQKNKILVTVFVVFLLAAITSWALGYNPVFIIVLGSLVLFLFYVLWDMHRNIRRFHTKTSSVLCGLLIGVKLLIWESLTGLRTKRNGIDRKQNSIGCYCAST